jgi:FMN phosphatase YigB (HAD superfamily)
VNLSLSPQSRPFYFGGENIYIFFDYDGTLIKNEEKEFQKYYFSSFLNYTGLDKSIINIVLECTVELIKKDNNDKNNLEYYMDLMERKTGKDSKYWYNTFLDFYNNEFPKLKEIIKPNEKLINKIKNSNHKFVFASNPVFPEVAVKHRIEFINLNPNDFIYVSTMENSHYCKPNPKYFIEIINKLDIKPEDCLMIGDTEFDMASIKAGIKFIHVSEERKWDELI